MKKLLIVALSVILVLMMTAAAIAAPVITFNGNVRTWYVSAFDGKSSTLSGFQFDRFELTMNAKFSDKSGITSTTSVRGIKSADVREEAFYWVKGLLSGADELDIGAFGLNVPMPFRNNGATNSIVTIGAGNAMKLGQTVGLIYKYTQPTYDLALGLCNARQDTNVSSAGDALNDTFRFNYYPYKGWKVGFGYEIVSPSDGNYNYTSLHDQRWVLDAAFKGDPFMVEVDFGNVARTTPTSTTFYSGLSAEFGYKKGPITAWVGRVIDCNGDFVKTFYGGSTTGSSSPSKTNNDFTVVGFMYSTPVNVDITLEYVKVDDFPGTSGENSLGVRFQTKF